MMQLKNFSTQDLRNELELRGFQTDNLWSVHDVTNRYDVESDVAMDILKDALNNEWIVEQVFEVIDEYVRENYKLKLKS